MSEFNKQLGDYTLIRKIGSGGMADVWMAERAAMGAHKTVAIKLLNAVSREKPEYRQMFLDEARLSMLLNNSSIVQVFDAGECDGECFMAMEWIDGINLSQLNAMLWDRGERLPLEVVAYIIGEILRALDHAHNVRTNDSASIVHRDVSPQNVMVSVAGEVKLMDFGVARFSTEETAGIHVKGKLRYMPPEQLQGMSREPTVDLFAVGAVLHEMFEGCRFRDDWDDLQLLTMIMKGEVPPLTNPERLPPELVSVMSGLLEPNSQLRIGTARGALRMLTEWRGYRNAAIVLESYVARFRDLVPPLAPTMSTGSGGDVHARIAARAAMHSGSQGGSDSQRSWRGVNPSTDATHDQLESDAIDDTNVGSISRSNAPMRMRGAAALLASMALLLGGVTAGIAFRASVPDADAESESESESEPEPEPEPSVVPIAPPDQAEAPEPPEPPEPSKPPEPPEPSKPPEPSPVEDVPLPDDKVDTAEDLIVDTVDVEAPKAPKQKVKVTFVANEYRFVYVKVDRKELALEPSQEIELLVGGHTIYMRTSKSEDYVKIRRHRFKPGHDYKVLMTNPGGFKVVQVN